MSKLPGEFYRWREGIVWIKPDDFPQYRPATVKERHQHPPLPKDLRKLFGAFGV